jgi:hypothetical protein
MTNNDFNAKSINGTRLKQTIEQFDLPQIKLELHFLITNVNELIRIQFLFLLFHIKLNTYHI